MFWLVLLIGCSEYNIDGQKLASAGNDVGADTADPQRDTANSVDTSAVTDTADVDGPIVETDTVHVEPSAEPTSEPSAEDTTVVEPSTEDTVVTEPSTEIDGPGDDTATTDGGFDPNSSTGLGQVGNVVTILMALSNQWIPEVTATQLIMNAVNFVSAVPDPQILIIRDDNTHGEDEDDPVNCSNWLQNAGYTVTFMEEPNNGISVQDLQGYHVVIFSNPGYPPDDNSTIDALYTFSQQGYGVIVQGDDMTRTNNPNMSALTRLVGVDNGTSYYGVNIDNNAGAAYSVRMVAANVLNSGIQTTTFTYGNDIDTTNLASTGIYVAAWATVQGTTHPEKPVITAFSPYQTVFQ